MKKRLTYTLKYNGKIYHYYGESTAEVMEKFANRKVFGNPIICNFSLKIVDAYTQGQLWAEYIADGKPLAIDY